MEHALKKQADYKLTTYGTTFPFFPITALALACDNFNTSMAKLLIKFGADCDNAQSLLDENGNEIRMRDCDYFYKSVDQMREVEDFQRELNEHR